MPIEFVTSEKVTVDYVNRSRSLKKVFPRHFTDPDLRKFSIDRELLVDKLLEYNTQVGAPQRVKENIESLLQNNTHAVITGQQPGLFSGPIYAIYKAISAIIACERLSTSEYSLVPVFWNASEDHDFSEVNHIGLFKENELHEIRYDNVSTELPLSHVALDKEKMKTMLTAIGDVSPETEFKAKLLEEIQELIADSLTVGDFYSKIMINLFGDNGLILVEPHYFRRLMCPIFERLVRRPTECTRILNDAGMQLRRLGYSPRIHKRPDICNFFFINDEGKRERVAYNGQFVTATQVFSQKELLDVLDTDPSRFSANAVIRPVTQDLLFPTFAYIAGPNETAYLAQLKPIYDFFAVEMPVVVPRFGVTIVERKVSKVLEKYRVGIQDLRNPEKFLKDLAKEELDGVFKPFKSEVAKSIAEVTQRAESIDPTLTGSCTLAQGRILKSIDALENKLASRLKEQNTLIKEQIAKAHDNIFPRGQLQERQINILEYLIKFGREFLRVVFENLRDADYGEHRVIKW
ncbi:MAG: bacillithiol biosynthesis cysteine-adding enzyme BshC [Candidatus Bathyarchaeota archaeon]|nr:MAG: bacillithiol biosynthesis cysteine-adding enzyme BshC [Candidatus Bathyarchaeota archaeon]